MLKKDGIYTIIIKWIKKILDNPRNVKFNDLQNICRKCFGNPRITGSHHIFKTPWEGKPFKNIQRDGKMTKGYQVREVKKAIEKLEAFDEK
jgi:hypothetical protein